jgi:hypothetical protein
MVFNNNLLLGASGAAGGSYTIDQSIRFNRDDDAKLTRTFGTATNRRIYTLSTWEKNAKAAGSLIEYNATGGVTWANITFGQDGRFDFFDYSGGAARIDLRSSAIYRDPSAWYHVVVAVDTTQAISTDRIKMYVNGVQITSFGTATYPSQNFDGFINSAVSHLIGDGVNGPFDGYLAEYHFIDGQALDPTSFGETNDDGVWVPIAYTGTYGTNGFYITGATASDLGEDFSGNNNDFTSSGLDTTDQMLDTPTDNWSTWNPTSGTWIYPATFSDGNLTAIRSGSGTNIVGSTISFPATGNWYAEFTIDATGSGSFIWQVGIIEVDDAERFDTVEPRLGEAAKGYAYTTNWSGSPVPSKQNNNSAVSYGTLGTATDVIGVHLNNGTLVFYHNNVSQGTAYSGITGEYIFAWSGQAGAKVTANFGQKGFTYTPPSSAVAVTTANLPVPIIADPSAYFQTLAYASTGTSTAFVQDGNSQFESGLVWVKSRTGANNHLWFDQVRGATKFIRSDTVDAENTVADTLTAFNSNGFTAGADASNWGINYPGRNNVAWQWKANGSGSSNTDGSINTTATSANTTAGFSISTYTGNGTSGATFGHGLGVAPKMVIVKERSPGGNNWMVGHDSLGWTKYIALDTTAAAVTSSTRWNDTAPSSTVVTLGNDAGINANTATYVAYCFAEVEGFSSFGSYTGNGSADGPFVYIGFKPALVLLKRTNTTQEWQLYDNQRDPYNVANHKLEPNSSNAESILTTDNNLDFLSNGFKLRKGNGGMNASGSTYIYMAFAENPFGGAGIAPATAR